MNLLRGRTILEEGVLGQHCIDGSIARQVHVCANRRAVDRVENLPLIGQPREIHEVFSVDIFVRAIKDRRLDAVGNFESLTVIEGSGTSFDKVPHSLAFRLGFSNVHQGQLEVSILLSIYLSQVHVMKVGFSVGWYFGDGNRIRNIQKTRDEWTKYKS